MKVDPCGVEVGVTQDLLDDLDVIVGLVHVRSESVTQRPGCGRFLDRSLAECIEESTLDAPLRDRAIDRGIRREEPLRRTAGLPVSAQEIERRVGKEREAILVAFTLIDTDAHAHTVDV